MLVFTYIFIKFAVQRQGTQSKDIERMKNVVEDQQILGSLPYFKFITVH